MQRAGHSWSPLILFDTLCCAPSSVASLSCWPSLASCSRRYVCLQRLRASFLKERMDSTPRQTQSYGGAAGPPDQITTSTGPVSAAAQPPAGTIAVVSSPGVVLPLSPPSPPPRPVAAPAPQVQATAEPAPQATPPPPPPPKSVAAPAAQVQAAIQPLLQPAPQAGMVAQFPPQPGASFQPASREGAVVDPHAAQMPLQP